MVNGIVARDGKAGSHSWVEIKLNDNTWWPVDPQDSDPIMVHKGYIPMHVTKMFEATSWADALQVYQQERALDMEWYDGGISVIQN
jgi:transglutaminase-like putative cysteine protease